MQYFFTKWEYTKKRRCVYASNLSVPTALPLLSGRSIVWMWVQGWWETGGGGGERAGLCEPHLVLVQVGTLQHRCLSASRPHLGSHGAQGCPSVGSHGTQGYPSVRGRSTNHPGSTDGGHCLGKDREQGRRRRNRQVKWRGRYSILKGRGGREIRGCTD